MKNRSGSALTFAPRRRGEYRCNQTGERVRNCDRYRRTHAKRAATPPAPAAPSAPPAPPPPRVRSPYKCRSCGAGFNTRPFMGDCPKCQGYETVSAVA